MNLLPQLAEKNVNKANQNQKNIRPRQVTLYCNVFYSRVSTAVVLCLCTSFLLQPIERIYAFEEASTPAALNEVTNFAIDASLNDPVVDTGFSSTTQTTESPAAVSNFEANATGEEAAQLPDDSASTTTDSGGREAGNPPSPVSTSTAATSTQLTDQEIQDLITDDDKLPPIDTIEATTSATTTDNPVAISTVHSDAVMQFNRNDCVTVEDGSFYCQSKKAESEQGTDGLYSLQDKDGDLEIFLQKNGELTQLTFNTIDDAAPAFDTKSNSIVWHRLVDERYQIISYDIDTREEVQLTADSVNNMEPSRSGNYTVWQRWHNNNWDIVLYDGRESKFISDSPLNDIAPNVKGDLVMWNRLSTDNTQSIELYDIATGEYTTITDKEGGALSNPRMVLVYETQFANGDVVTKGYDVKTGEVTPLANNPSDLPEKLPEPDATGETRALVQPKNPVKEDSDLAEGIFPGIDINPNNTGTSTATTTTTLLQSGDLLISSSSVLYAGSTPVATSTTNATPNFTLDLTPPAVINPDTSADLLVAPFTPSLQFIDVETTQ